MVIAAGPAGMGSVHPDHRRSRALTWRTAGVSVRAIAQDLKQIEQLARSYTKAWCSRDPEQVARHYVRGGTIAINGGDPSGIADVAAGFIAAFPDIEVFHDDLVLRDDGSVKYGWTFTGTSAETGKHVRVPGFEEWTLSPDGLIAESRGHYDQAEYDRQVQHGIGAAT
jgi:hypothetical protein